MILYWILKITIAITRGNKTLGVGMRPRFSGILWGFKYLFGNIDNF